jgi:hypothetical protein
VLGPPAMSTRVPGEHPPSAGPDLVLDPARRPGARPGCAVTMLFGDGAGAVVLGPRAMSSTWSIEPHPRRGSEAEILWTEYPASSRHPRITTWCSIQLADLVLDPARRPCARPRRREAVVERRCPARRLRCSTSPPGSAGASSPTWRSIQLTDLVLDLDRRRDRRRRLATQCVIFPAKVRYPARAPLSDRAKALRSVDGIEHATQGAA